MAEDAPLSLVLPRAGSSRQAAQLLGALLSVHGAREGFGVLMADSRYCSRLWLLLARYCCF